MFIAERVKSTMNNNFFTLLTFNFTDSGMAQNIYLFVYSLLNNIFHRSDYTPSNDRNGKAVGRLVIAMTIQVFTHKDAAIPQKACQDGKSP